MAVPILNDADLRCPETHWLPSFLPHLNARMLWEVEPWKAPTTEKSVTLITLLHCIYLNERSLAPLSLTGRVSKKNWGWSICLFISTAPPQETEPPPSFYYGSRGYKFCSSLTDGGCKEWKQSKRALWFPLSRMVQVSCLAFSSAFLGHRQDAKSWREIPFLVLKLDSAEQERCKNIPLFLTQPTKCLWSYFLPFCVFRLEGEVSFSTSPCEFAIFLSPLRWCPVWVPPRSGAHEKGQKSPWNSPGLV